MKHLKILISMAVVAMGLIISVGAASATQLARYTAPGSNDPIASGSTVTISQAAGTSWLMEDAFGLTAVTCAGTHVHGHLLLVIGSRWYIRPTSVTTSSCGHTVDVEANGEMEIKNIAGTTNGTVFSSGAKTKIFNTLLNQNCIANTGAGTDIGTLTGATSSGSNATIDLNGLIPLEGCSASSARETGTWVVTSPTGLIVEA